MLWLSLTWAAVVAAALLFVIGVPLARLIGLRGSASVAVAPAFSMAVVCAASVVLPLVRLPWAAWSVAIVAVVVAAIAVGARYATRDLRLVPAPRRGFDSWLLAAFAIAMALLAARTVLVLQEPDRISQTFDNVFHLNAVRWILDNGSASSFQIGYLTSPRGPAAFYPAGWHALVALVVQLSGASIPVAVNAVVLVVSAVVWPLGMLFLGRTLLGTSPAVTVAVALVSASVPAFPLALMDFGVLYPFQLGLALLPVAIALTASLLRLTSFGEDLRILWGCVALAAALGGLTLVHPGALVAWLALTGAMAVVFVVQRWRVASTRRTRLPLAAWTVVYLVIAAAMVYVLRPPGEARTWPPEMTVNAALAKLITVAPWYPSAAILVAIGALFGIVWAATSRDSATIAALGMYIVAAILYVVSASIRFPYRDILTAPWYNNIPRLAAILSIAVIPVAAYGFVGLWRRAKSAAARQGWAPSTHRVAAVTTLVLFALALQTGPLSAMPAAQRVAMGSFALTDDTPLLSTDELALIRRLDEHVPADATIAGSPWTGTSLAYALAGRRVLMPHILMQISPELQEINDELDEATPGSPVCAAMADLGVRYVLDFGEREVHGAVHDFAGFDDLTDSDAVRLIDSEGEARLYEVVACGS